MSFEQKLHAAQAELRDKQIGRRHQRSPLARLLGLVGIKLAPAFYRSFVANLAVYSVFYGLLLLLISGIEAWTKQGNVAVVRMALTVIIGGVGFGLLMAIFYRWAHRKLGLTPWQQLP